MREDSCALCLCQLCEKNEHSKRAQRTRALRETTIWTKVAQDIEREARCQLKITREEERERDACGEGGWGGACIV